LIGIERDVDDVGLLSTQTSSSLDEGMTNGPPIFAYLVFGSRRVSLEWLLRPIKAAV
jgi:hypothetical protein